MATNYPATSFVKPAGTESGVGTGFGLPPDLLEKARKRVKTVGALVLLAAGVDLIIMPISLAVTGPVDVRSLTLGRILPFIANVVTVLSSVVLIIAARSDRVRDRVVLNLALAFEVLFCLMISVSNPLAVYEDTGSLPTMTWVTPLIIFFPLIVPYPPRRTLLVALLAASTSPLGVFILTAAGRVPNVGESYLVAAFAPLLAVVIAVFGSRVVYGLGLDVAKAQRMGSYQLERRLGRGGMGEVWLARHRLLARPAAVKLIRPELLGVGDGAVREVVLQRFEREAQATAALRSPHTIDLYDFGVASDGTFYYVMELLEGFDLQTLVRRFGPVSAERAIHLLRQVCHSIAEAHQKGLIHRDIKPANIYACCYGSDVDFVKVLDFGLVKGAAKEPDDAPALTAENAVHGTPAYMAPERATGRNEDDARSDIYAIGCVGYWLLTGRLVFVGETPMEILIHHARTAPSPPSRNTEISIPEPLDRLILSCLEKDPDRRPPSAGVLAERLACCSPETWTQEQARRWWSLHALSAETAAAG